MCFCTSKGDWPGWSAKPISKAEEEGLMMDEALRVVTVLGGVENHYFSESI